jgi:hypothetical protein
MATPMNATNASPKTQLATLECGNAAATQSTTNNAINVVQNATRLEGVGR